MASLAQNVKILPQRQRWGEAGLILAGMWRRGMLQVENPGQNPTGRPQSTAGVGRPRSCVNMTGIRPWLRAPPSPPLPITSCWAPACADKLKLVLVRSVSAARCRAVSGAAGIFFQLKKKKGKDAFLVITAGAMRRC